MATVLQRSETDDAKAPPLGSTAAGQLGSPANAGGPARWQLRLGRRTYPVVAPSIRDPRIHLSMVILSVIAIGITWLHFRLSLPQLLLTVIACGLTEVLITLRRTSRIVWPGSAMQTATSTALVLRVPGVGIHDLWSFRGAWIFVLVGLFGVATKYLIRFRSGHIFNPSNVGLVVAFLVLGSSRIQPLDFWWVPLSPAMLAVYAVLLAGGYFICRRLALLEMAMTFWAILLIGLSVLATVGHSISAEWSFIPISGGHFVWIVVTSPEVLIFALFMITDPKTVPKGRVARLAFAVSAGVASTVLMAPWKTEFGAKVGLLSGLVVVCLLRPVFVRSFPVAGSVEDHPRAFIASFFSDQRAVGGRRRLAVRSALVATGLVLVGAGVAAAGVPNRTAAWTAPDVTVDPEVVRVDPSSLPLVQIDPEIASLSASLATPEGAQQLLVTLDWNLKVEAEAFRDVNASLLPAVDHGQRLVDLDAAIARSVTEGTRTISTYTFDQVHLVVVFPGGVQQGPNAGLVSTGTVTQVTYSPNGSVLSSTEQAFSTTFSLRQTTPGRWLTSDTLEETT